MIDQPLETGAVGHEVAVGKPVTVRKYEDRPRQALGARNVHGRTREVHGEPVHLLAIRDHRRQALRPQSAERLGIALAKAERRHAVVTQPEHRGHRRAPGALHPDVAPCPQVVRRERVQLGDQVRPRRVPELELLEVVSQAIPERVFAHPLLELPHDDGCLLVDDGPVERARLVQIGERLADRIRSCRAVDGVGGRMMRQHEPQLVVDFWERRIDDLRRHEVGEDLLHPDVVEPAHGHEVPEPHVRRLVRDEARTAEHLALRRGRLQEETRRPVEDGARVLHPSVLKRRHGKEVELGEGERDPGVVLQPGQGLGLEIEDRVPIRAHARGVGLPVEHPEMPPIPIRFLDLELPRRERNEIRGDRRCLREAGYP